jgi:hypothetical protein
MIQGMKHGSVGRMYQGVGLYEQIYDSRDEAWICRANVSRRMGLDKQIYDSE